MPSPSDPGTRPEPPRFETLEERLLLTTLSGGEFFIYLNSHDEAVRVSLHGDPSDQIELLAWDGNQGGLVDLVGIPGDMNTDGTTHVRIDDRVKWPDGQDIIEFDDDGAATGWWAFGPGDPDADPPTSEVRGAGTEIWSIYVATCSTDTVLTLSTLDSSAIDWDNPPDDWELWNISTWASTVPFAGQIPSTGPGPATDVSAPADSGGVLVGGIRVFDPDPDDPDTSLKFVAVQDDYDVFSPKVFGVFPKGRIHPGIDIADTADDFGRIMAAGTVAGGVTTDYNIDTLYMGFLYGNVEIGENLGTIGMRKGGGAVMQPDAPDPSTDGSDYISPMNGSMITVNGHLTLVESRGGEDAGGMNGQTLYSTIQVLDDPAIDAPEDTIYELEVATDDHSPWDDNNEQNRKQAWVYGFITDDPGSVSNYNNDLPGLAQFLSHPTGDFTLIGSLDGDGGWRFADLDISLPEERDEATPHPYDVDDYWQDWYAMPLFASQTLVLDYAIFSDIATYVRLYDWDGNWMDSYGYESQQDTGVSSRGTTAKAMRFTAPAAGVYYICVLASSEDDAGNYELKFTNATRGALGAVSVVGHYDAARVGHLTTMLTGDAHIAADYNGIGAVEITDSSYNTVVKTYRGGDIVSFQAGTVGQLVNTGYSTNYIISEGNIGRVAATAQGGYSSDTDPATAGFLSADIEAGAFGGTYNHNAHIQNIYAASDFIYLNSVKASGSIGVVEIERHLSVSGNVPAVRSVEFQVNTDGVGPAGHIDFFDVGSNWNSPTINTGLNGNVGYINVGGIVRNWRLDWSGPVEPVTITNGTASTLYDDGGGQVTIVPVPVPVDLVNNNDPTLLVPDGIQDVDPVTYMPVYYRASYSYLMIGINDAYDGGTGGVIANITADGPVSFNTTGDVEISNLDISWFWNEPDPSNPDPSRPLDINVNFGGSGEANVYYVHDYHGDQEGNFNSVSLSTSGHLVSGHMAYTRVSQLKLGGSLGPLTGHTGAWIHGRDAAPLIPDPDDMDVEPRFGWFHGTVNGLAMGEMNGIGDDTIGINKVVVDGAIGDLRVMGTIGTIRADADKITQFGNWDGIMGLVWSNTRLDKVYVGDGLANDGGGDKPKAAILSSGFIGLVSIEGPYYVQEPLPSADLDKRLAGGMAFGLLDGSIIGRLNGYGEIVLDGDGNPVVDVLGNTTTQNYDAVHRVIGTKGAVLTANVLGFGLDAFWAAKTSGYTFTGGVGTVDFSGPGAMIDGSEIAGAYVRKISTSADSGGINWSHISGGSPFSGAGVVIGEILAGGPGMRNTNVVVTGGSIGTVRGIGPIADLYRSVFVGGAGMKYLSFRDINMNGIHMPGAVETIHAWRDMSFNDVGSGANYGAYVGAIKRLTVGRDFVMNGLHVASELTMNVKGNFTDSTITMYGQSSQLKSLTVDGNISGQIQCAGRIGSIISKNGQISADIITLNDDGDVGLLQAAGGFAGDVTVGGSLGRIISYTSLGNNPAAHNGLTQYINVGGNLDYVRAVGSKTTSSHLYADFAVGGNIGTIDVDGTFYSNVITNGNLKKLLLDGALGGNLGGTVGDRGSLNVFGTIGQMKFNTNSDLVADLYIGGSINKIALKNSSIRGDIESRFGSINQIYVNGGSILGTITARSIGTVRVNGGSISGDVTTTAGDIKRIQINGGNLNANVTSAGRISLLNLVGGSAIGGHTILGEQGIGKVMIRGGNLDADLISGAGIDRIQVNDGSITGMVSAALGIRQVNTTGAIANTTIRAGGTIARLDAANLNNAIISSGWDISKVKINGSMVASKILAGYDVGDDGVLGGGDDNPLNGGVVHSGTISKLDIRGALNGSVVMAGIDPTGNSEADGVSSISRMTVRGGYIGSSEVRADTYIDSKFAAEAAAAGVTVSSGVTYIPDTTGTIPFGPDTVIGRTLTVGELSLTLTSGTGYYRASTGELILVGTSSRSSLTLRNDGAPVTISIESADDSGLRNLRVIGNITLGDMDVDGQIKSLQAYSVAPGSTWNLPGGVRSAKLGALTNVDVSAGYVQDWKVSGAYSSGTFTADGMKQFRVDSTMGANMIISLGGAHRIQVRGNQTGDIESRDTIKTLDVRGALSGDVTVTHGDLTTVKTGGTLSGAVDVTRGYTKQVRISSGDFGGSADTSFRAARGIRKFDVSRGNLAGLVSTGGDLRDLKVARGRISGRVWSGGSIRNVRVYGIDQGLIAASGDILKVKITGDMFGGWILAGFDPGDAGYDPAHGGERGNLKLDRFTSSSHQTPENTDQASAGTIKQVDIGGDMGRTYNPTWGYWYLGSTIAAGIDPGPDGYIGTPDDLVAATGYVHKVRVKGGIFDSIGTVGRYGVYAANNMPAVYQYRNQPFYFTGKVEVGTLLHSAGPPVVMDIFISYDSISVQFNHPVNMGTIDEYSFTILGSADMVFDPLVDTNVSTTVANTISYDASHYMVTFRLDSGTWQSIGVGSYFQVTLDGSVITDIRGLLLDGEMSALFPSGDHIPGGDFVYEFAYGQYNLSADVPAYTWWHGCSPTAAGMLAGYYDGLGYDDLIVGDASTQTDDVNEAIASSGDGVYTGGGGVIVSGTVGTGHIPDYALYNDIDDSSQPWLEPDMSEDWIVALEGVLPHPDDCLADFMGTSQSALGLSMGWSFRSNIAPGIEDYFDYKGYTAEATTLMWGQFSWMDYVSSVSQGRPVQLSVDSDGDGATDHSVIGIGYDLLTRQYAIYDTWDTSVHWYEFQPVNRVDPWGIGGATFVEVA